MINKTSTGFLILLSATGTSACNKNPAAEFNLDKAALKWNTTTIKWSSEQLATLEAGEGLYLKYCAACHLSNGQGNMTNGFPPLKGSAIVKGPVANHIKIVLFSKKASVMPAFNNLTNSQLAKIITYERNAWTNVSGDWLDEKDILQARQQKVNKHEK